MWNIELMSSQMQYNFATVFDEDTEPNPHEDEEIVFEEEDLITLELVAEDERGEGEDVHFLIEVCS